MRNSKRFAWFAVALVFAFAGSAIAGELANSVVVFDWDTGSEDEGGFKTYDGASGLNGLATAGGNIQEAEIFVFPVIENPNPVVGADGIATHVMPAFLQATQGSMAIDKTILIMNRFRLDVDLTDDGLLNPTGSTFALPADDPQAQFLLSYFRDDDGETVIGHPLPYGYVGTMRFNAQRAIAATEEVVWNFDIFTLTNQETTATEDAQTDSFGADIAPVIVASSGSAELGGSITFNLSKWISALRINSAVDESTIDWTVTRTSGTADVSVEGQTGLIFSKTVTEPSIVVTTSGSGTANVSVAASIGDTDIPAEAVVFQAANPVELASFGGALVEEQVVLNWTTASQTNNAGWRILRSQDGENYEAVGAFVEGAGTTDELLSYSFSDAGAPQAGTVYYMLEQMDLDGTVHLSSPVEILLGARFDEIPQEFGISAYPNPFNPSTTISYDLPSDELVSIVIYDVLGQEVRRLIGEQKTAGRYSIQWDARDNGGRSVATGVYIAKIEAGTFTQSQKMLLLK
jgi:hypothetical protein